MSWSGQDGFQRRLHSDTGQRLLELGSWNKRRKSQDKSRIIGRMKDPSTGNKLCRKWPGSNMDNPFCNLLVTWSLQDSMMEEGSEREKERRELVNQLFNSSIFAIAEAARIESKWVSNPHSHSFPLCLELFAHRFPNSQADFRSNEPKAQTGMDLTPRCGPRLALPCLEWCVRDGGNRAILSPIPDPRSIFLFPSSTWAIFITDTISTFQHYLTWKLDSWCTSSLLVMAPFLCLAIIIQQRSETPPAHLSFGSAHA